MAPVVYMAMFYVYAVEICLGLDIWHTITGENMITLICTKSWGTCRKAVALLHEKNIKHEYREYKKDPLTSAEITAILKKLNVPAKTLLRKRDKAYKALNLTGEESDAELIPHFANNPTLLQRPIAIRHNAAVVCRPVERLLELIEE